MTVHTKKGTDLISINEANKDHVEHYQPDVRGWNTLDSNGKLIGKISDVLVDDNEVAIRYLILEVDRAHQWYLLLPIGQFGVDEQQKYLQLKEYTKDDIRKLPRYENHSFNRKFETELLNKLKSQKVLYPEELESDFYNNHHFQEHTVFNQRYTRRNKTESASKHDRLNFN